MSAAAGLLGHGPDPAWWQECLRTGIVFVYGLLLLRLAGRRIFGRWAALDIVVSVVFGSSLSRALTGTAPFAGTLAAMTLLVAMHWLLSHAAARWPRISRLVEGAMIELARGGAEHRRALRRHAVSDGDLDEALRRAGVERSAETRLIALEPSGKITVLKSK